MTIGDQSSTTIPAIARAALHAGYPRGAHAMKKILAVAVLTALALPASAADSKVVALEACNDAGFDSGAIDHFMTLIQNERSRPGTVDGDLLHAWGEQVRCYAARLAGVAASFKQQTGRKFSVEKTCGTGAPHQAYANGFAAGSSPDSTCKPSSIP